ncbi:hypothetical protein BpHYR1_052066, partial [Brachionus plicatilis]
FFAGCKLFNLQSAEITNNEKTNDFVFTKFKILVLYEFHIFDSKFVIYTQGSKNSKPFKKLLFFKTQNLKDKT